MRVGRKIVHEGRVWYSGPAAARLLHKTTATIREIMGKAQVEWIQLKTGGKLLVSVESLLSFEQQKAAPKKPL